MDFESISLAARTHCLGSAAVPRPVPVKDKASPPASAGVEMQEVQSRVPQPWVSLLRKMFLSMRSVLQLLAAVRLPLPLLAVPPGGLWKATARGFEALQAEPNGFRVHLLSRSDTLS